MVPVAVPVRIDIVPVASDVSKLMLARVEAAEPVSPEALLEVRVVVIELSTVTVFVVLSWARIKVGRPNARRVVERMFLA